MAYFAEIDTDGTVIRVISVSNADAPDPAPEHSEPLGQAFIASIGIPGTFRQTSYHGSFRKMYAPVGGRYLADMDVFIWPQPFPSWTLDGNHDWQPPTPRPPEGRWYWDEDNVAWVEVSEN